MKTLILNLFGALMLFGLNTCTNQSDEVADAMLVDTKWDLQSFEIVGGTESDIGSQGIILKFTKDGRVEGEAYRIYGDPDVHGNSYGGVYEVGLNDSLSIEITHTTYMGLPPGSRYEVYIQAIKNASAYEINGNMLNIFYGGRTKALNFKVQ